MNRTFVVSAILLGVPSASALAQTLASCAPLDSAVVTRWHARWDSGDRGSQQEPSVVELGTLPVNPHHPSVSAIYGRWDLTTVLARSEAPDLIAYGTAVFTPPIDSLQKWYGDDPVISKRQLISGWVVGHGIVEELQAGDLDSVAIDGAIDERSGLSFSNRYLWDDGGGFGAVEFDSSGARGWWTPPGAVKPPFLGWFCLKREK